MLTRDKFICADLESIRKHGPDFFIRNSKWPVTEIEFQAFSKLLSETFLSTILSVENDFIFNIAQIELSHVNQLINIFHFNYIKNYSSEKGIEILHGDEAKSFVKPDWKNIGCHYRNFFVNNSYHYLQKRKIRKFAKNYIFNKHLDYLGFFGKGTETQFVGLGSYTCLKKEYIEKRKAYCKHLDALDFFEDVDFDHQEIECHDFVEKFSTCIIIPFIKKIFSKGGMFIKNLNEEEIIDSWSQRINDIYKLLHAVKYSGRAKSLLVTTSSSIGKVIALGLLYKGFDIIHFSHGNDHHMLDLKWGNETTISFSRKYVVETEKLRLRFEKSRSGRALEKRTNTIYITDDSDKFHKLRINNIENSYVYDKIILMGFPMNSLRYVDDAFLFFNYKLLLELNILKKKKKLNKVEDIVYKAHPEKAKEISTLYAPYVDRIVTKKFESYVDMGSILIFTYISTTTFAYALNLPIPIILINVDGTPWNTGMIEKLSKRVAIINCSYNNGIPFLDEIELKNSFIEAKSKINLEVAADITG